MLQLWKLYWNNFSLQQKKEKITAIKTASNIPLVRNEIYVNIFSVKWF